MSRPRAGVARRSRPRPRRGAAGSGGCQRARPRAGASRPPTRAGRERASPSLGATAFGPERMHVAEDTFAELVPGARESEGRVRVQALEAAGATGAADAEVERRSSVAAGLAGGELVTDAPLLGVGTGATVGKRGLGVDTRAPALDAAVRLEPRDGRDEVAAGDVVRRRERLPVGCVRLLLSHRRAAEGAADDDAAERARLAPELARDDLAISLSVHAAAN